MDKSNINGRQGGSALDGLELPKRASVPADSNNVFVAIPIRVTRFDEERGRFSERTHTQEVTSWGARIVLISHVLPGDTLRILNLENHFEGDFRVVGLTRWGGGSDSEWAFECLEKGRTIWDLRFPRAREPDAPKPAASLECRACHSQEGFPLSTPEDLVLNASGLVVQRCVSCRKGTYWIHADEERRPEAFPFEDLAPPPREPVKRYIDTRLHARVPMEAPIEITSPSGEVEHTMTLNISLGGFAAILQMNLAVGDIVNFVCSKFSEGQRVRLVAQCVRTEPVTHEDPERIYGFKVLTGKPSE